MARWISVGSLDLRVSLHGAAAAAGKSACCKAVGADGPRPAAFGAVGAATIGWLDAQ